MQKKDILAHMDEFASQVSSFRKQMDETSAEVKRTRDKLNRLEEETASEAARRTFEGSPAVYHGKSILWLDDRPELLLAIRQELEKRNIHVKPIKSTPELFETIGKARSGEKFDLIISDMHHDQNTRGGLDDFLLLEGREDLPPRVIFTSNNRLQALGPKERQEVQELQERDKRFLGIATSIDALFKNISHALGALPERITANYKD